LVGLLGSLACGSDVRDLRMPRRVGLYERLPMAFDLPGTAATPYDPDVLAVDAEFRAPSGAVVDVPAFYYRPPAAQAADDDGRTGWRVRFTPTETGTWFVRLGVSRGGGAPSRGSLHAFRVTPTPARGFVARRDGRFRLTTGEAFLALGANRCWGDDLAPEEYLRDLAALGESGARVVRVWLAPWWLPVEPRPGEYDPSACARLDAIFAQAEDVGLRIILCIEQHGSLQPAGGEIGLWPRHPYNRANGGPCGSVRDFFTDAEAARLFRNRLRYLVARYGYSRALMAWELMNEAEYVGFAGSRFDEQRVVVARWHRAQSAWLREHDPFGHLIATSADVSLQETLARAGVVDFIQLHIYGQDDLPGWIRLGVDEVEERHDLPLLVSEFGLKEKPMGPEAVTRGLFAAMLLTGGGGALPWLQDEDDPAPAYARLGGAAAFFRHVPWSDAAFEPDATPLRADGVAWMGEAPRLLTVRGGDHALLFLYGRAQRPPDRRVKTFSAALKGMPGGDYRIEFWNARTGTVIETQAAHAADGALKVVFPDALDDVAVKVLPVRDPLRRGRAPGGTSQAGGPARRRP
jgi:hypothetical protein